jgi:hypothetical protein
MNAVCERTVVTASVVAEDDRLEFLPKHLTLPAMRRFEATLFGWMSTLCKSYTGGYWEAMELSNGGFFMYPTIQEKTSFELVNHGNSFRGSLTAEAAGIVVTLYTLNELFLTRGGDSLEEKRRALREYAEGHSEAAVIRKAIS